MPLVPALAERVGGGLPPRRRMRSHTSNGGELRYKLNWRSVTRQLPNVRSPSERRGTPSRTSSPVKTPKNSAAESIRIYSSATRAESPPSSEYRCRSSAIDNDDPPALLQRLTAYVGELNLAREELRFVAIRGRVQIILNALEKLRGQYAQFAFDPELIAAIQEQKRLAELEAVIPMLHAERLRELGVSNEGVRPSSHPRRHHVQCYACHTGLDSAVDLECVRCGWILCNCGACGCGYRRRMRTRIREA